jgi:hypothetical protein
VGLPGRFSFCLALGACEGKARRGFRWNLIVLPARNSTRGDCPSGNRLAFSDTSRPLLFVFPKKEKATSCEVAFLENYSLYA